MKARIAWSVLSCLIILSLVAAACAPVQTPVPTPEILSTGDVVIKVSPAVVWIVADYGKEYISGTGMFISADGYVLTNEHVVSECHYATLNLPDKSSIQAEVIYRDQALDIAILKSAGINYPVVILGSTTKPMLGEDVVALGFPSAAELGSSVSVSRGIISAFRTIDGVRYIQSDVALNPGSSGGPMVNMYGEVIGMNALKLTESEGISFAIDINSIKIRIESIVQQHKDSLLAVEKPPIETEPPVENAEEGIEPSAPPEEEWVEWSKAFSGAGDDRGYSVQQTSDGGYVIAGSTDTGARGYDVYLIKTDSSGNMTWSKTFGSTGIDSARSVQQTSDGGYIITGTTEPSGMASRDVYLIKTDSSGDMVWSKTFGETNSEDSGGSVQQTSDGGYIIAGYTKSFGADYADVYLIKTDSSGNEVWSKTFGGTGTEGGRSVQQTSDGGYIIICSTSSFGAGVSDAYLIKTDSSGNEVWSKTFGGTGQDSAMSGQQTADGGYIIAGFTHSFGNGGADVYLIKTDSSGNEVWSKTFGGTTEEQGHSVQQTADGGYIIAGSTYSLGTGDREGYVEQSDVYLVKTDSSGNMTWSKTFGSTGSDAGLSVQQTVDGSYIITGYYNISPPYGHGDVYLVKLRR